jgi:peptidylprolyl isomerase
MAEQGEVQAGPRTVESGSFVMVDYVITAKETGELVDTTLEEKARKKGISTTGAFFEPRLAVIGKGMLLRALEEEMVGMKEGDHKSVVIPPERAFGPRDPGKVKVIPIRRLKDLDQPITVGTRLVIDGKEGVVRSIESGRVLVDFNHHLAGKTLECEVWVRKVIAEDAEKVLQLLHSHLPEANSSNTEVKVEGDMVTVRLPKEVFNVPGLQVVKRSLVREVADSIKGISKVVFVEEWSVQG